MIEAHHIVGFKSIELGRIVYNPDDSSVLSETTESLNARFEEIKRAGCIRARGGSASPFDPGRSTWEDDLPGDDQYVFLSVGSRYLDQAPEQCTYGFVFDAEELIESGAILGVRDLATDYTDIIGEVAEAVAATLPRLPRISDEELSEFAALMGETDPAILQAVSDGSTDPENDLLRALSDGDVEFPGVFECLEMIRERIGELHKQTRFQGGPALAYLRSHAGIDGTMEVLVKGQLSLSLAKFEIRGGQIK